MECKHGVPYEAKCFSCTQEALEKVRLFQQAPDPNATPEEKYQFWKQVYTNTQPLRKE